MTRIVTTMTVIPTREMSAIQAILSIQSGYIKPDAMYINIPKTYVRFEEKLKSWFRPVMKELGVTVIELGDDRCCLNKILPILSIEKDPETLVVTIDDDIIYKPLFIKGLYDGYLQFGGVVGYSGMIYPEKCINSIINGHGGHTDIIQQGFGTMTKLSSFYDFPELPPLTKDMDPTLYLTDDYVISRFYDFKVITKTIIDWKEIGRTGDDWSRICTLLPSRNELSKYRDSTDDYLKAGRLINEMWVWPYFTEPVIYYINLDHRTDRRAEIEEEIKKFPYFKHRISAFHTPGFGAIGCTLSHIKTLETFLQSSYSYCYIFEDDFTFTRSPSDIVLPYEWDVVMLSGNERLTDSFDDIFDRALRVWAPSGYIVHRRFAPTLLNNMKEGVKLLHKTYDKQRYALDTYWEKLQKTSKWYIFKHKFGLQRKSWSDIENFIADYKV